MPLCQQKRTLASTIGQIFLAPFIFLAVNILSSSVFLLLALSLLVWSIWLNQQPLASLIPPWKSLGLSGLIVLFLMLAAIPLAIRDHFANGGYERVWKKSAAALEAGQQYAEWLRTGQLDALAAHFTPALKADPPFRRGHHQWPEFLWLNDPPIQLLDAEERHLTDETAFDWQCDTHVSFRYLHRSSQISQGSMFLDSQNDYQIVHIFPPTKQTQP